MALFKYDKFFRYIVILLLILIFIFLMLGIFSNIILLQPDPNDVRASSSNALNLPISTNHFIGNFFNKLTDSFFGLEPTWKNFIIGLALFFIILTASYDILQLISIFDSRLTLWSFAIGMGVIAALLGFVGTIAVWMAAAAATVGTIGIFLEIIIVFVLFIFISFGAGWAARFAARRRAMRIMARSEEAGGYIAGLITAARRGLNT